MTPFVICMLVIWGSAAIGAIATKNDASFFAALVATIAIGFGYYLFK